MQAVRAARNRAVVALMSACLFWGLSFCLTKALSQSIELASPGISSWFVAAYLVGSRFLVAAIVLVAVGRIRPNRSELFQGILLGAVTGVGMLFQTDALTYTSASTGAFLTQGYVFMLPVVTTIVTRKLPSIRVVACALLVLVGLGILAKFDPFAVTMGRGETETLLAAACFTAQILTLGAPRFGENRAREVTVVMFVAMTAVMAPIAALTARSASEYVTPLVVPWALVYLAAIVVFPTLGSFLLMNRFQRLVTPSDAGVIYATEPVFAGAFALFVPATLSRLSGIPYPDEVFTERTLVGGVLVLAANVLLALAEKAPSALPEGVVPE
jgi:drug/metabolite transporter (DMT)-like permease